jgi:two-component system osmolarity sensor histidine kinase EnvZ
MHLPRRLDSLFMRLLLTQLALVASLGVVFGGLFYLERNATIATLYAQLWAPQLAQAVGQPSPQAIPAQVLRQTGEPAHTRRLPALTPRFIALHNTLAQQGVAVDQVRLSGRGAEPIVWLHVVPPQAPAVWLGMPGEMVLTEWPLRVVLAALALFALLVLASWTFTRRLTRPLEQLRTRIQGGTSPVNVVGSTLPAGSSPEIAAIDAAYSQALARLAQHQHERAVLLAGVSHDLRSPLGRIRMAAELLPDTPDTSKRKESIARNVGVADRLIESFLDYVRSDTLALDETVDLAEAVRNAVARCDRPTEELRVEAPASLLRPKANALLVDRLVSNLVDNALKYGQTPVSVQLRQQGPEIWLDVTDAGPGITGEDAAHLQQAFSRGASSRSIPGTGLGLAIVRQIAEHMGGQLEFTGQPGAHTARVWLKTCAGGGATEPLRSRDR